MYADQNIIAIKHQILEEVARHAFAGDLEEARDHIPEQIVPGPNANFRCCIYKEREVTRQRIRLAEGKSAGPEDDGNVIQVIKAACQDCPISSYVVTDNCQSCVGKACLSACKFGAISVGASKSQIDPKKCKECGMCAKECPFGAIAHLKRPCKNSCPVDAITYDEHGISVIDEKKCIRCGQCIHKCPFGAIGSKTDIVNVINALKSDKKVYAIMAPSLEGQFGTDITMKSWADVLEKVGFDGFYEGGLGGDMTTASEGDEWLEAMAEGKSKTTSCCPGFVNMVRKHFPDLSDNISTTVSPMCAVSRMVKAKDPGAVTVFIGPCIAKKSEVKDQKIEGNADYVLTGSELNAILRAKGLQQQPAENTYQEASVYGKYFGNSGGVTKAVLQYMKEKGVKDNVEVCVANGAAECRKALLLMKAGRLPEQFIEGMACEGGCVGGPSRYKDPAPTKKFRDELIGQADTRSITGNLQNYDMESFSMHRH